MPALFSRQGAGQTSDGLGINKTASYRKVEFFNATSRRLMNKLEYRHGTVIRDRIPTQLKYKYESLPLHKYGSASGT